MEEKKIIESRELNIGYFKSGSGSYTSRFPVPITWLRMMGVTMEEREVTAEFDGEKITIRKRKASSQQESAGI